MNIEVSGTSYLYVYILLIRHFMLKLLTDIDLTVICDVDSFVGISKVEYRQYFMSLAGFR